MMGMVKCVFMDVEVGELIWWLFNFFVLIDDVCMFYFWICIRGVEIVSMEVEEILEEVDGLWWIVLYGKMKNVKNEGVIDLCVLLVGCVEVVVCRCLVMVG